MAHKQTPAERIARRLAALGVPASQLAELVGASWREAHGPLEVERLQAVWRLAEVYARIVDDEPRCFAELEDATRVCVELGCWFEPSAAAAARLEARAGWSRATARIRYRSDAERRMIPARDEGAS